MLPAIPVSKEGKEGGVSACNYGHPGLQPWKALGASLEHVLIRASLDGPNGAHHIMYLGRHFGC